VRSHRNPGTATKAEILKSEPADAVNLMEIDDYALPDDLAGQEVTWHFVRDGLYCVAVAEIGPDCFATGSWTPIASLPYVQRRYVGLR
jgi:hypothetical protein